MNDDNLRGIHHHTPCSLTNVLGAVLQTSFQVTDASNPTLATAPRYYREIRVPALWQFNSVTECPRPTVNDGSVYGSVCPHPHTNPSHLSLSLSHEPPSKHAYTCPPPGHGPGTTG